MAAVVIPAVAVEEYHRATARLRAAAADIPVVDLPRHTERPVRVAVAVDIPVAVAVDTPVAVVADTPVAVAADRRPPAMVHPPRRVTEHLLHRAMGHRPVVADTPVAVAAAVVSGVVSVEELLPAATEHRRPAAMEHRLVAEEDHRLLVTEPRLLRPAAMERHPEDVHPRPMVRLRAEAADSAEVADLEEVAVSVVAVSAAVNRPRPTGHLPAVAEDHRPRTAHLLAAAAVEVSLRATEHPPRQVTEHPRPRVMGHRRVAAAVADLPVATEHPHPQVMEHLLAAAVVATVVAVDSMVAAADSVVAVDIPVAAERRPPHTVHLREVAADIPAVAEDRLRLTVPHPAAAAVSEEGKEIFAIKCEIIP